MTLPLPRYADPIILEAETRRLSHVGSHYVGHTRWAPDVGDYHVSPIDESLVLINHAGTPTVLDNVCAHRQATLLESSGHLGSVLTCPIHTWSYRLDGSLLNSPGIDPAQCHGLAQHDLWSWNELLFSGSPADLSDLNQSSIREFLNFDGYSLHRVTTDHYNFDWKIFLEVYLDLYHVRPFHRGLGRLVDCERLSWEFGENWSCQIAPFGSLKAGTPAFEPWCNLIAERHPDGPPFGALWLTIYPNLTVEWYPDTLVVSTILPDGPGRSVNVVEFYYPDNLGDGLDGYAKAHRDAYEETAVEDGEICERMQRGKAALWRRGVDADSPDHNPLELGIGHFHRWLETHLPL